MKNKTVLIVIGITAALAAGYFITKAASNKSEKEANALKEKASSVLSQADNVQVSEVPAPPQNPNSLIGIILSGIGDAIKGVGKKV